MNHPNTPPMAPWVIAETQDADLTDKRLDRRLREVLQQLGEHPAASIPAACGGHTEMTAAYRFFANPEATFERILAPHHAATQRRMAQQEVVLLVQDTTEVDVTRPQQQVAGAGPLGTQEARQGLFLHPLHAFTPDGTPLGTLQTQHWAREPVVPARPSRAQRAAVPIEEKESYRWVEMLQAAAAQAVRCPATQLICVGDSESDIYELLAQTTHSPAVSWIVRACQNRALIAPAADPTAPTHLWERGLAQPVLFEQTITVRGRQTKVSCEKRGRRQPRQSRSATVAVRATTVTLRPPWRGDRKLPEVTANVVLVREMRPPKGDVAVEWLLLTDLPVETPEQVRQVIQYYCVRWMIEVFFRVLKSGCRVEQRQFERIDRLQACLAVYLIIAWRTLYVCRLGRSCPQVSCEAVFEPAEWQAVWQVTQESSPPRKPPPLGQMVQWVAQLGGYVPRKGGGPPGPQTVWIGLQRVHDFALCWKRFGPGTRKRKKDV
jgi:hypothetical protein